MLSSIRFTNQLWNFIRLRFFISVQSEFAKSLTFKEANSSRVKKVFNQIDEFIN